MQGRSAHGGIGETSLEPRPGMPDIPDIRGLNAADKRLLLAIAGVVLVGIGLGLFWLSWANNNLLHHVGRHAAVRWASKIEKALDLEALLTGHHLSHEAEDVLRLSTALGDVFRYRIYDPHGVVVLDSDTQSHDSAGHHSKSSIWQTIVKGETVVGIELNQSDKPVLHYAQAYVPQMDGATLRGAIEVFVDIGPHVVMHRRGFAVAAAGLLGLLLIGAMIAGFIIFRNILERKNHERRLRTANKKITKLNEDLERRVQQRTAELRTAQDELLVQERLATLGQLTATVAHELRNPLGVIRNSIHLVIEMTKDSDLGLTRPLDRTERNIMRCDKIVEELLDFTRSRPLELQPVLLDDWLKNVIADQAVPQGITVRYELDMPGLEWPLDEARFRRAVINVVQNGIDAMINAAEENEEAPTGQLAVRTTAADGCAVILFTDTGPGMAPDICAQIFEPLFSTKTYGVGLGLPTVKQIMDQHGGGVDIASEPGEGSTVTLTLPTGSAKKREQAA